MFEPWKWLIQPEVIRVFCSIEQLGVLLLSLDRMHFYTYGDTELLKCPRTFCILGHRRYICLTYFMLVHLRVIPSSKFADTHLYTSVERDTVCSKTQTRLVPETLDLEASILTMRPPNIAILSNWSQIWFCT